MARSSPGHPRGVPGREYRLVVEGELSDTLAPAFEGMALTRDHGTTVLVGTVRDQAELQGILQRVSGLGLTLLSAVAVGEADDRLTVEGES
jgi:hypothetical protein